MSIRVNGSLGGLGGLTPKQKRVTRLQNAINGYIERKAAHLNRVAVDGKMGNETLERTIEVVAHGNGAGTITVSIPIGQDHLLGQINVFSMAIESALARGTSARSSFKPMLFKRVTKQPTAEPPPDDSPRQPSSRLEPLDDTDDADDIVDQQSGNADEDDELIEQQVAESDGKIFGIDKTVAMVGGGLALLLLLKFTVLK